MNKFRPKKNYKNKLTDRARKQECLNLSEIQHIYPNRENELLLWIRNNKENGEISENKAQIRVSLIKLEADRRYSIGLFTFLNKHTNNIFQLDIKYYGKLWWLFS